MNNMTDCQHIRQSLGIYVVGAIDPAERSVVDNHLATCPECREELAGLAGLPALLGRVPFAEAEEITRFDSERAEAGEHPVAEPAEADVLTPLLAKVAHRRRVSRWRSLVSVAAVAVIAAGAAIGAIRLANPPAARTSALHWESVQTANALAHMEVKYAGIPGGVRLDVRVAGIPAGTTCQFWVIGDDGQRWPAGSWTVADQWNPSWYPTVSAAPVHEVSSFRLTSGGKTLAQVQAG
jgi:anti-sigma factor RsiW